MSSCVTDRTSRRRRKQVISESSEEGESDVEEAPCRSPVDEERDQPGHSENLPTETSPPTCRRLTMQVTQTCKKKKSRRETPPPQRPS